MSFAAFMRMQTYSNSSPPPPLFPSLYPPKKGSLATSIHNYKSEESGWAGLETTLYAITGLDAAGKTTTLYRLHLGEVMTTIPTIGI